jgi:hypothetical protein
MPVSLNFFPLHPEHPLQVTVAKVLQSSPKFCVHSEMCFDVKRLMCPVWYFVITALSFTMRKQRIRCVSSCSSLVNIFLKPVQKTRAHQPKRPSRLRDDIFGTNWFESNRSMGGKNGSGSLFCAPNRQFFPGWSHFHIFTETISPAGLQLPPIHVSLCLLIPLTCLLHRFPVNGSFTYLAYFYLQHFLKTVDHMLLTI